MKTSAGAGEDFARPSRGHANIQGMPTAPTVFISYSQKDEVWKNRLLTHLRISEKEGFLELWDDRRIKAGSEWRSEIQKAIDTADIGILLISADFLVSDFIRDEEIPRPLGGRIEKAPDLAGDRGHFRIPAVSPKIGEGTGSSGPDLDRCQPGDDLPVAGADHHRDEAHTVLAAPLQHARALPTLHQLPTPPADFTGRQEDLDFLRSKLSQGGTGAIFGLRGMGGVGKTTLALKFAEEIKPRFPDARSIWISRGWTHNP